MASPFKIIFSQPEYERLELAFEEGFRNPIAEIRNPVLVNKLKYKRAVLLFCAGTKQLKDDAELWEALKRTATRFRVMRFRQFILGNIVKGIFIFHKEKAKKFYEYCERRFLKAFRRSLNKRLDEVIVLRKIYPEIPISEPIFKPPVRFHREYDEQFWNEFYKRSTSCLQAETARDRAWALSYEDLSKMVEGSWQEAGGLTDADEGQSSTVPVGARVGVHATERPAHPLETIQDDRRTSMDEFIDDLLSNIVTTRPEVDMVRPVADMVTTRVEELQIRTSSTNIADNVLELPPHTSVAPFEVFSSERAVDFSGAIQVNRQIEERMPKDLVIADLPSTEDICIGRPPMDFVSDIGRDPEQLLFIGIRPDQPDFFGLAERTEPQERRTGITDSPLVPVPAPVTVIADIHSFGRSMDPLITDSRPSKDTVAPAQMDVIEHDPDQPISDQIAEIVQPADINIQQLQRDFDRIELISVEEIELPRVDDVPTSRPDQLEIPGIVVTELEKTRTDSVVEAEVIPESGRAEELMEVVPQPSGEIGPIRISDLMREDVSWEKARQKKTKKKIPVSLSLQQMKRIINRPLAPSDDPPTLVAQVYSECRPNVFSPLRLLRQEPMDIHDMYEAPINYADELKKNQPKDCKLTLQQVIPFCHGVIFERLKSGFMGEMTEQELQDRETGQRALRTITNFSKIPFQVMQRFYGDESPPKTRPSFRRDAEDQQLDIPGMARKSSIPQSRESHQSLVPVVTVPPRPSIEPFMAGQALERTVLDESLIAQLPPPEHAHITAPEEELNQTGAIGEPRRSALIPAVAIGEDWNRLEVVEEARPSMPAPSRLETASEQIPSVPDDQHLLEAIQQPRAFVAARHDVAPVDADRMERAEQSRTTIAIPEKHFKHIVKSHVIDRLAFLLRRMEGKVTFLDLCPPRSTVRITRKQAAATFSLLIELDRMKQIRLEYEVAENICDSQIVIYSQ